MIPAPLPVTYRALWDVDFSRSWIIRMLFTLRGLGRIFRDRRTMRIRLVDFLHTGFILLGERQGEEIVIGLVGRPDRPGTRPAPVSPDRFAAFDTPGWVKAAMNFKLEPLSGGSTLVTTETRVFATDEEARRSFARYWLVIRPFSALIRRSMLAVLQSELHRRAQGTFPSVS